MNKLFDRFIYKRYHLVLEERCVVYALSVINKYHRIIPNMAVGNCGWADRRKWFIDFTTTERKWKRIREELNVIRVFDVCDIPPNLVGFIYTTD